VHHLRPHVAQAHAVTCCVARLSAGTLSSACAVSLAAALFAEALHVCQPAVCAACKVQDAHAVRQRALANAVLVILTRGYPREACASEHQNLTLATRTVSRLLRIGSLA
jgi:hypothetical protein